MNSTLVSQLINGVGLGATYALIGLGFGLLYRVVRALNLAFGEIFMIAAMSASAVAGLGPVGASPLVYGGAAIITAIVVGLGIHLLAVRPLGDLADPRSPQHATALISTIGAGIALQNVTVLVRGSYPQAFPALFPTTQYRILGLEVSSSSLGAAGVAAAVMVLLHLLLTRTLFGLRVRATAEERDLAEMSGIHVAHAELAGVALSAALAGLAAVIVCGMTGTASPTMGATYGFKALVVVIASGSGRPQAIVLTAMALGFGESLAVAFSNSGYRDAVAYVVLLTYLMAYPAEPGARRLA